MKPLIPAFLLAAGLLSGCNPDVMNTKPEVKGLKGAAPVQTLFEPEAKSEVTLRPGGLLRVELEANATTGYMWSVLDGYDSAVVSLTTDDYKSDANPSGMVGVGGTHIFTFTGGQKGKTEIHLRESRGPSDVVDERVIHVKVIE